MKKILSLLFLVFAFAANSQTQTFNSAVYFKNVPQGTKNDSVAVLSSDGRFKFMKRTDFLGSSHIPNLQEVLDEGRVADQSITLKSAPYLIANSSSIVTGGWMNTGTSNNMWHTVDFDINASSVGTMSFRADSGIGLNSNSRTNITASDSIDISTPKIKLNSPIVQASGSVNAEQFRLPSAGNFYIWNEDGDAKLEGEANILIQSNNVVNIKGLAYTLLNSEVRIQPVPETINTMDKILAIDAGNGSLYTVDKSTINSRPYKSFVATLNQSGTSNPVANVLENELGTFNMVYDAVGNYYISFSSTVLTSGKVFVTLGTVGDDVTDASYSGRVYVDSTSEIFIQTSQANDRTDGFLIDTPFEIRVYD